jgi:hypothetical protein
MSADPLYLGWAWFWDEEGVVWVTSEETGGKRHKSLRLGQLSAINFKSQFKSGTASVPVLLIGVMIDLAVEKRFALQVVSMVVNKMPSGLRQRFSGIEDKEPKDRTKVWVGFAGAWCCLGDLL